MPCFFVITLGQAVSRLGTGMTSFATVIWAWELTGQATALALVSFFSFLPWLFASPFAGVLVDRLDRKLVMALSDLASGSTTIAILVLYLGGNLQVWHLYAAAAISGAFGAFQFPAYSAAISSMLSKEQYARASGMLSLSRTVPNIAAPILAGALLAVIGFAGILVIDITTFSLAVASLAFILVPGVRAGERVESGFWSDTLYGFRYIFARPGLLGLQLTFSLLNLAAVLGFTVQSPMILARSGNDEVVLAATRSAGAVGGVVGGLLLSLWGGPRRKIHGVLGGLILASLLGQVLLGVGREVVAWSVATFSVGMLAIVINGSNQAIWQAKVEPAVQGRVFATRSVISRLTTPLSMLLAGPLADRVFEPAMMPGGSLAGMFGAVVGTGAGAGMALILFLAGCLGVAGGALGYAVRLVREVEVLVPDHDIATASAD